MTFDRPWDDPDSYEDARGAAYEAAMHDDGLGDPHRPSPSELADDAAHDRDELLVCHRCGGRHRPSQPCAGR